MRLIKFYANFAREKATAEDYRWGDTAKVLIDLNLW